MALVILVVVVVLVFGWKRLPDAARSLGRSMRIFKAEVGEMKNDAKPHQPSAAASDTVRGQTVQQPPTAAGTTAAGPAHAAGRTGRRPHPHAPRDALGRARLAALAAAPGLRTARRTSRHHPWPSCAGDTTPRGGCRSADHLRELRNRLIIALIAIVAGGVVGWLVYDQLLTDLSEPLLALRSAAAAATWSS